MRSLRLIVPMLALALVAAGCGESDDYESTTLSLESPAVESDLLENAPQGPSRGDTVVFAAPLSEEGRGEVGRFEGTGTVTDIDEGGAEPVELRSSLVQFTLEEGTLVVAGVYSTPLGGRVPADEGVTRPVLGGTGEYEGARGEVTQTPTSNGGQRHVFEIETPSD